MTYQIFLRRRPTNGYTATALGWPDCQVTAPTREAALQQIQIAIADLLTNNEVVDIEIPTPVVVGSYADVCGQPNRSVDVRHAHRLTDFNITRSHP